MSFTGQDQLIARNKKNSWNLSTERMWSLNMITRPFNYWGKNFVRLSDFAP